MKSKRLLIDTDVNYEFVRELGWKTTPIMKYQLIEETGYTMERIITGYNVAVKLYITDPTSAISETIIEAMEARFQLKKWVHVCDNTEDSNTFTSSNGTVAYNHLINNGVAESFGLGVYEAGEYNILDWTYGLTNSGAGGASPTAYSSGVNFLPDLSSSGITMTFTPNVSNETDDRLVILVEGNLI